MTSASPPLPADDATFDPVAGLAEWMHRAHTVYLRSLHEDTIDDADYGWVIWSCVQERRGQLNGLQRQMLADLPASVRAICQRGWGLQFLAVAHRNDAGLELSGGWHSQWLSRQRSAHTTGTLSPAREWLLSQLEGFSWDPAQQRWEEMFGEVAAFVVEHGVIPSRGDDLRLANWLARQRFLLRGDRLRFDRAQMLEQLPGWTQTMSSTRARSSWERRCEQLRGFIETHRRYPCPDSDEPAEAAAARWVTTQREQLRRDGLSPYRIAALSALPGWRWAARDVAWDERFRELRAQAARGGIGTDHPLYSWVIAQRRRHRDGRLSTEQVNKLESLNLLGSRLPHAA